MRWSLRDGEVSELLRASKPLKGEDMIPRETPRLPRPRAVLSVALAALLTVSLASCAPEPDEIAGAKTKDQIAESDGSGDAEERGERAEIPDDAIQKHTELPEGFPSEAFPLPKGAVIDDTGERASGEWFVVLRAENAEEAEALWNGVIAGGGFEVSDQAGDPQRDASATLRGSGLEVFALMLPQEDESVLLSYDLTAQPEG